MPTSESGSNNLHYSWELGDIVSKVPDDGSECSNVIEAFTTNSNGTVSSLPVFVP